MVKLNALSLIFVVVYLFQFLFSLWLERLNRDHLQRSGNQVPTRFREFIDKETLARINTYSVVKSRLSDLRKAAMDIALLVIILTGILPMGDSYSVNPEVHYIWAGLIFFVSVGVLLFIIELPFEYYDTFIIEEKYGFNKSDLKTWAADNLKSALLSIVLLICVMAPLLWTIERSPNYWWLWGFIIVAVIQLGVVVIYPVLIAPLFNKFEPLEDRDLVHGVEELVKSVGMETGGIFKMDAGRRSTHSNAYFTGFGKTKRIVLFDTLVDRHTRDEILAVLAHELGHFKLKHIWKFYAAGQFAMLVGFYIFHFMLTWDLLYATFRVHPSQSYIALFLAGIFWLKSGFFLKPIYAGWSRRFEKQADAFAARLRENPQALASALKKMGAHNLSNLTPHPFYAWFYYSHPPLPERVASLEDQTFG
ncbi:MAG: M48 family metallopeptidase [Desulfomonilaceae bacterium]